MTVNLKDTIQVIQNHLTASAIFADVQIGEPMSAPDTGDKAWAAILLGPRRILETTLATSIEERSVIIRIYINVKREPQQDIEFEMDEIASDTLSRLGGDFELGGDIRQIWVVGMTGAPAYQTVGVNMYRLMDIMVPMIVDDSVTWSA